MSPFFQISINPVWPTTVKQRAEVVFSVVGLQKIWRFFPTDFPPAVDFNNPTVIPGFLTWQSPKVRVSSNQGVHV
jgi:hypothetical protein